jgi:hypothetical protein
MEARKSDKWNRLQKPQDVRLHEFTSTETIMLTACRVFTALFQIGTSFSSYGTNVVPMFPNAQQHVS